MLKSWFHTFEGDSGAVFFEICRSEVGRNGSGFRTSSQELRIESWLQIEAYRNILTTMTMMSPKISTQNLWGVESGISPKKNCTKVSLFMWRHCPFKNGALGEMGWMLLLFASYCRELENSIIGVDWAKNTTHLMWLPCFFDFDINWWRNCFHLPTMTGAIEDLMETDVMRIDVLKRTRIGENFHGCVFLPTSLWQHDTNQIQLQFCWWPKENYRSQSANSDMVAWL